MGVVPKNIADRIAWYQARESAWTTSATGLGLSTAEMTTMSGYITAAATALTDQVNKKDLAKAATVTLHDADAIMARYGSDLIQKIRAKAGQVGGDSVYALAMIPPPATPSPVAAPGQPTELNVVLTQTGALDMTWKCPNPTRSQGTVYNIFRYSGNGVPTDADYTYVGGSGVKEFTDETAPAGAARIMYKIQAVRSTKVGPFATFNVFLGVNTGGGLMIQSVENTSQKLAA